MGIFEGGAMRSAAVPAAKHRIVSVEDARAAHAGGTVFRVQVSRH